jgi:hypothetical protein
VSTARRSIGGGPGEILRLRRHPGSIRKSVRVLAGVTSRELSPCTVGRCLYARAARQAICASPSFEDAGECRCSGLERDDGTGVACCTLYSFRPGPVTKSCLRRALRAGRLFLWDVPRARPCILSAHPIPCTARHRMASAFVGGSGVYASTAPSGIRSSFR